MRETEMAVLLGKTLKVFKTSHKKTAPSPKHNVLIYYGPLIRLRHTALQKCVLID